MANDNLDMFTKLTNSLIVIIISFLPFKEAARTSILSKRWRNLWHATKSLEFNESIFVNSGESDENKQTQRRVFIDFVRQWIANYHQPIINKFALTFSKPNDFLDDMQHFVMFSTTHNVKVLDLDFSDPTWREDDLENHAALFDLPSHVYGHEILESLKLFSCNFIVSDMKNFSLLKEISLGWIELKLSSIKALLENCPLLESFRLKKCYNIEHLDISLPNLRLKTLVVDKCNFDTDWFFIEGPKLSFFKYSGTVGDFHLENQRCLEEADLDFGLEFEFQEIGELLYNLLQDLFAVKTLTICSYMLQVLPSGEEPLGMKSPLNVRHLIMRTAMHEDEFCGIKFLLKSCPLLKTLTFEIGPARVFPDYSPPYAFDPNIFWTRDIIVYKCIRRTLKVVEVKGFRGTMNELYVIQYLVAFGRVMEHVTLYLSREADAEGGNRERYLQRAEMVQNFKRASSNLIISIV